ncbi:type I restriction enzyme, S subunit [Geopseudomonas sagittaria]|uniref:Type I restriction enzyme, S subunit n=1 Tax=Geopseudomonas sagittaria TaxID=1135990 RepID=A0A1I5XHD8_9GAMM|nr:restriction endonuclease subunit S [Pseudomonas sagittaria]MCM2329686.1 restriction endonuclease subunit S [Pseudomonas sagittaria]SFQ31067.1 type I restriction enzyme, S subunit [Pseudomonas sagittaria]
MSWPTKSLADIAILNPRIPKDRELPDTVVFLPMAAISEHGEILAQELRPLAEVRKGFTYFARGDVLLAKITPCFENGKAAFLENLQGDVGFGSTEFHVIRPNAEVLDGKYLFYMLWNDKLRHDGELNMTGSAGQRRVPTGFLERYRIPLPPLAVQRHIAKALEQVDRLRRQAQQMETELDRLAQGLFLEMFPEATRVAGQFTEPLGTHIAFLTSGSRGWAEFYADRGAIFIRSLDVRMNELNTNEVAYVSPPCSAESKRTKVEAGDVLLTITGSCIGRVCEVPSGLGEAYISQHVSLMRLESSLNPTFLSFFLSLPSGGQLQISKLQYGQTKPGLNLEQIRSLQIPAVTIDRQIQFVVALQKIEAQRQMARRQQAELEQAFQSLIQRAFKGELTPKVA